MQPSVPFSRGRARFRASFLFLLTAYAGFDLASAQGRFGRAANQPWSGGVTVIDESLSDAQRMKTSMHQSNVGGLAKPDRTSARALESGPIANLPPAAAKPKMPKAPTRVTVELGPVMRAKWQQAREKMKTDAEAFLREKKIEGGFRIGKPRLNLAPDGSLFVGQDGGGFTIRFLLSGNSLNTWIRTPSAKPEVPGVPLPEIGAGEALDPGFAVTFDLEVSLEVELRGNRLVANPAQIKANVQQPMGTNATGKAAVAARNFLKSFLGGRDFLDNLLAKVNSGQFSFDAGINQELAKLNPLLDQAAGRGTVVPGYDGNRITLTFLPAGRGPIVN